MKKTISILFLTAVIGGTIVTSCQSSTEKIDDAQNAVIDAKYDLHDAKLEYQAEIDDLIKVAEEKAAANDKILADFDARIETQKAEAKAEYKEQIAVLEKKNSDLRMKMANYKELGKENWEKFKSDFNSSMDDLVQTCKDLTVIAVK